MVTSKMQVTFYVCNIPLYIIFSNVDPLTIMSQQTSIKRVVSPEYIVDSFFAPCLQFDLIYKLLDVSLCSLLAIIAIPQSP